MNARFFAPALSPSPAASRCFAGEEPIRYTMTPVGEHLAPGQRDGRCGRKLGALVLRERGRLKNCGAGSPVSPPEPARGFISSSTGRRRMSEPYRVSVAA